MTALTVNVSADGSTWTTVATVLDNTANVTSHTVGLTGRYVRLDVVAPQGADPAARIFELKVFG